MSIARSLLVALPLAAGCFPTMPVYTPPPAYNPPSQQAAMATNLPPGYETVPAGASLDPEHPERDPWLVRTAVSALDGSTNVYAGKSSASYGDHWGQRHTPGIGLSCEEGKLRFVLSAGLLDYDFIDSKKRAHLTVRIGEAAPVEVLADLGNDHSTAYLPDVAELLPKLRAAQRVVIRFTPLESQPVTSEFQLSEIGTVLDRIQTACPAR
jgi:hypothetical protein